MIFKRFIEGLKSVTYVQEVLQRSWSLKMNPNHTKPYIFWYYIESDGFIFKYFLMKSRLEVALVVYVPTPY